MRNGLAVVALFIVFVLALNNDTGANPNRVAHPNGLSAIPSFEYHSLEQTHKGFVFMLNAPDSRYNNSITLERRKTHGLTQPESRVTVAGARYLYDLEEFSGGSGGSEWRLRVWKPMAEGGVMLVHREQSEWRVDFSKAWNLIERAQWRPSESDH